MQRLLAVLLLMSLGLPACSGIRIRHQVDDEFDFTQLSTYEFGGVHQARSYRVARHVRAETDRVLQEKGYEPVAEDASFRVTVRFDTKIRAGGEGDHVVDSSGSFPEEFDMGNTASGHYVGREGQMRLELTDAGTGGVVWRGIAAGSLQVQMPDEKRDRLVTQVITRLLAELPTRNDDG